MKPFHEVQASDLGSHSLQDEVASKGYLLIRNLLPQHALSQALGDITRILYSAGWLVRDDDPLERMADIGAACGDPDPSFQRTYQLVGEKILIHPKPIGRLIFPRCERLLNHGHQDFGFMNGDSECFTAWIPLHDCPTRLGPLQIMEGSHRSGFQDHDHENLRVLEIPERPALSGHWVGGQIDAGDVLIFHSRTVHAAPPNLSKQLRISLDCRFQDYGRAVNPATLTFAGESAKSWEKTYSGWRSDELKFYWKKLPLRFDPSMAELEQLAKTADSPRKRGRYVRILSQLEEFAECASR